MDETLENRRGRKSLREGGRRDEKTQRERESLKGELFVSFHASVRTVCM